MENVGELLALQAALRPARPPIGTGFPRLVGA